MWMILLGKVPYHHVTLCEGYSKMADDMAQQNDVNVEHPSLFKITQVQKERMDRNRMKAKSLKHGRLVTSYHPCKGEQGQKTPEVPVSVSSGPSRGGYMLDTTDRDKIAREYRIVDDEGIQYFVCVLMPMMVDFLI